MEKLANEIIDNPTQEPLRIKNSVVLPFTILIQHRWLKSTFSEEKLIWHSQYHGCWLPQWWYNEPGHQQPWYWLRLQGIFFCFHGKCLVSYCKSRDAVWHHRSSSTLVQVVAWHLMAPSHYLKQCWIIISKAQWHSSEDNFTKDTSLRHWSLKFYLQIPYLKSIIILPHRRQDEWLGRTLLMPEQCTEFRLTVLIQFLEILSRSHKDPFYMFSWLKFMQISFAWYYQLPASKRSKFQPLWWHWEFHTRRSFFQ